MNALDEDNKVVVGGNTFTFRPKQIKEIYQTDIAHIITRHKAEFGFVGLPDDLTYIAHVKPENFDKQVPEEHKALIEEARKSGVEAYCRRLRQLVYNMQVSLKQDLEKANIKADPKVFASDGDLRNLEQLVKYQAKREDIEQKRIDKLKELEKHLEKAGVSSKG